MLVQDYSVNHLNSPGNSLRLKGSGSRFTLTGYKELVNVDTLDPWIPAVFLPSAGNISNCSGPLCSLPSLTLVQYGLVPNNTLPLLSIKVSWEVPISHQFDYGAITSEASDCPTVAIALLNMSCAQYSPMD